jgi:hypothetical protein
MRRNNTIRTMGPPECRLRPIVEDDPKEGLDSTVAEIAGAVGAATGGASRLAKQGLARKKARQSKRKTLFIKNLLL